MLEVPALSKASCPSEPQETQHAGVAYYCQYPESASFIYFVYKRAVAEVRLAE
jgi:hypothetical protein